MNTGAGIYCVRYLDGYYYAYIFNPKGAGNTQHIIEISYEGYIGIWRNVGGTITKLS